MTESDVINCVWGVVVGGGGLCHGGQARLISFYITVW